MTKLTSIIFLSKTMALSSGKTPFTTEKTTNTSGFTNQINVQKILWPPKIFDLVESVISSINTARKSQEAIHGVFSCCNHTVTLAYEEDGLPEQFLRGLSAARLSGRAQIFVDPLINASGRSERLSGDLTFYLDGAHSPESMDACARWYSAAAVERKDLSLSSVSSKVETMEIAWTNSYIKHCHNEESDEILKRILLFNCMDARDPQILLPKLVDTCASSGVYFSKAIFVPSISAYTKVTSATSTIPSYILGKDLSWQFNLQRIWERIINGKDVPDQNLQIKASAGLPPREFLYEEASRCDPGDGYFACSSAVIPSLPLAINWLRDCVRENPSLRLQVLVTGSLHLVGDVLKLLRR